MEIFVDDDTKLTLHGLQQYYIRLDEAAKNRYSSWLVLVIIVEVTATQQL